MVIQHVGNPADPPIPTGLVGARAVGDTGRVGNDGVVARVLGRGDRYARGPHPRAPVPRPLTRSPHPCPRRDRPPHRGDAQLPDLPRLPRRRRWARTLRRAARHRATHRDGLGRRRRQHPPHAVGPPPPVEHPTEHPRTLGGADDHDRPTGRARPARRRRRPGARREPPRHRRPVRRSRHRQDHPRRRVHPPPLPASRSPGLVRPQRRARGRAAPTLPRPAHATDRRPSRRGHLRPRRCPRRRPRPGRPRVAAVPAGVTVTWCVR